MKTKNIILLFFAILTIVLQSCNSDKEQVESIKNRLYKIGILTSSNNKGTSYLNVLDDSINIIKFDINSSKLKENNKVVLTKILDSISGDILISRMTNCIIGEHYSISSATWKQMIAKVKNLPIGQGIMDAYTEGLNKELSLNNITITVYIKENNRCEIVTTYYSAMADLQAKIWGGLLGDLQKPSKKEFGTYKYIGDNTFEISNKMVLKIKDNQNCKAELSIKIPTEKEIKKSDEPLASTKTESSKKESPRGLPAVFNCIKNSNTKGKNLKQTSDNPNAYAFVDTDGTEFIFWANGDFAHWSGGGQAIGKWKSIGSNNFEAYVDWDGRRKYFRSETNQWAR